MELQKTHRQAAGIRVVARVAPFDLKGWDALIPALEGYALAGPVELGEVVVVTAAGALTGALLGGRSGFAIPTWDTVYDASKPPAFSLTMLPGREVRFAFRATPGP